MGLKELNSKRVTVVAEEVSTDSFIPQIFNNGPPGGMHHVSLV